jgi:DNA-binding response OmpR family regulator
MMTDPQARIRQLEIEKQRLLDENEVLKSALAGSVTVPREWGLTPKQADLMRVLIRRPVASYDACMAGLYSDRIAPPDQRIINVLISRMRRKLLPFGIEIRTVWGIGYELDEGARARLKNQENQAA